MPRKVRDSSPNRMVDASPFRAYGKRAAGCPESGETATPSVASTTEDSIFKSINDRTYYATRLQAGDIGALYRDPDDVRNTRGVQHT